jgi:hypothetical protein
MLLMHWDYLVNVFLKCIFVFGNLMESLWLDWIWGLNNLGEIWQWHTRCEQLKIRSIDPWECLQLATTIFLKMFIWKQALGSWILWMMHFHHLILRTFKVESLDFLTKKSRYSLTLISFCFQRYAHEIFHIQTSKLNFFNCNKKTRIVNPKWSFDS